MERQDKIQMSFKFRCKRIKCYLIVLTLTNYTLIQVSSSARIEKGKVFISLRISQGAA
jgi:hypothetical protein